MGEEGKVEEWELFKRFAGLEDLYLEQLRDIDSTRTVAFDALIIGSYSFLLLQVALSLQCKDVKEEEALDGLLKEKINESRLSDSFKNMLIKTIELKREKD